ncbi:MAG TPA: hypothetical protein VGB49_03635, partial [Caulobacteraceae bacterium]
MRLTTGIHMHLNASLLSAACALLLLAHTSANGQSYDPRTQSPMSLVAAPADAVAYNDARSQVRALLSQSKAAEAEPLAEQITRDYPRDGENWLLLGQVRRALQKYEEAAVAFERANTLLWSGGQNDALASAAITRMLAGDRRAALEHLRSYTRNNRNMDRMWIFGSPPFASLQADPEFLEIAGRPDTSGWSRDYGWRRDIVFLRDEALRMNAEYRGGGLPPDFERLHEALVRDVPRLSDEQIYVGMNRLLAVFRQGHTFVSAEKDSRLQYKGLPLQFWVFPEGIFVVSASPAHQNLVGSRLVSINDIPAEEALRRINETQSVDGDNEYIFQ